MGIRVAILGREAGYREALKAVIDSAGDMQCIGAHGGTETEQEALASRKPDVFLLVAKSPRDLTECVIKRLRSHSPPPAVIAIAASRKSPDILRALTAGATAYLLKSSSFTAICDAIRQCFRGGSSFSPELAAVVRRLFELPSNPADGEVMSERESQILDLLGKASRNKDIAIALNLSVPTVRTHLRTIYLKLRVRSRSEAVRKLESTQALKRWPDTKRIPASFSPASGNGTRRHEAGAGQHGSPSTRS